MQKFCKEGEGDELGVFKKGAAARRALEDKNVKN